MTQDIQTIKKDRLRFTKDSFPATLVILAIVLDCLYFVSIYESDVGNYFYNWLIGVSIVYNLVFLLAAFLASESVARPDTPVFWCCWVWSRLPVSLSCPQRHMQRLWWSTASNPS